MIHLFFLIKSSASSIANRSRTNSFSSVASDSTTYLFNNYSSPNRNFYPPSDLESELNDNENSFVDSTSNSDEARELRKKISVLKNKFTQLKRAYDEVDGEKEKIKVEIFKIENLV